MASSPRLTLGVLVFNQDPYVGALLESIYRQTVGTFKVIMVDNGSSDHSKMSIKKTLAGLDFKCQIDLIFNSENSGSAAGLNQLINTCSTDYLAVLHGDDLLDENYVKIVLETINQSPHIEAFNSTLLAFPNDSHTKITKTIYKPLWTEFQPLNRLLVCGLNPGVMPGSVLMCRFIRERALLEFDEVINGVEDSLLWMRIIRAGGRIQRINIPIYKYRIHKNQFSYEDSRNSFFFGLARKFVIEESRGALERFLSRAEVRYELKRFGSNSEYVKGLGLKEAQISRKFSHFRVANIILRRVASIMSK